MATTTAAALDPTRLIVATLTGLAILLLLIIRFKIQAIISILIGAVTAGLIAGMSFGDIISSVNEGISSMLRGVALLVDLDSVFGSILEILGGVQTLAVTVVKKFGDKKTAWALGITGLAITMPVFFDAGLIILIPLTLPLAKGTEHSSLFYAIPLLAGLAVGHAFIPPTSGPVLAATMLGVDPGWVITVGIVCGIFAMIVAGPTWGAICGNRYDISVPEHIVNQEGFDESRLPKFGTIVGIILVPLVLTILNSIVKVMPVLASVQPVLGFLGEPFVALIIATVVIMVLLGYRHGYSSGELEKVLTKSLEPTGPILLVIACGGVLRFMLQNSDPGDMTGSAVSSASLPIVVIAFVVAALVRISAGSATVTMAMVAGIIAAMPEIVAMSPLYLAYATAAVVGGAMACSHFNDSGFRLAKSLVGLDEKTTLKTWTIMEILVGGTGSMMVPIIPLFAQGWLDSGITYINSDMIKRFSIS